MTDDLLQAVRDLPKVSRYLHVPAQSGCDDVLRRMKRLYTVALYDDMMGRIRETVPDALGLQRLHRRLLRRDRGVVPEVGRPRRAFADSRTVSSSNTARGPGTKADALYRR